jgi:hypothetical protein
LTWLLLFLYIDNRKEYYFYIERHVTLYFFISCYIMPTDPYVWGPVAWALSFDVLRAGRTHILLDQPYKNVNHCTFLRLFADLLPCASCQPEYGALIRRHPPETATNILVWQWQRKCDVNARLGRTNLPLEQFQERLLQWSVFADTNAYIDYLALIAIIHHSKMDNVMHLTRLIIEAWHVAPNLILRRFAQRLEKELHRHHHDYLVALAHVREDDRVPADILQHWLDRWISQLAASTSSSSTIPPWQQTCPHPLYLSHKRQTQKK